jgi:hypothetical protein
LPLFRAGGGKTIGKQMVAQAMAGAMELPLLQRAAGPAGAGPTVRGAMSA